MESFIMVLALGVLAFNVWTFYVCWQKGRKTMFWLGIAGIVVPFIGVMHLIGAARLARPESPWAEERYGIQKMAKARRRFGDERVLPTPSQAQLLAR